VDSYTVLVTFPIIFIGELRDKTIFAYLVLGPYPGERHAYFVSNCKRLRKPERGSAEPGLNKCMGRRPSLGPSGVALNMNRHPARRRLIEQGQELARTDGIPIDHALWAFWYGMRIDRARDRSQIDALLDQWLARWCSIKIVARRVLAKCSPTS
jgi:hypothetical protein